MLYWLGKSLQVLLWPSNQALILFCVSLFLLWRGRLHLGRTLFSIGLAIFVFFSLPIVAITLYAPLETSYTPKRYKDYPKADAIVVLGGTASSLTPPRVEVEETHGSRLAPAYRLYRLEKAPVIILSSGSWYFTAQKERRVEAQDMAEFLKGIGCPEKALVLEGSSRNTYENAVESAAWLKAHGKKTVLLVTSAFHMRRAVPLFQEQGVEVIPVPTEQRLVDRSFGFWDFIPDPNSLGYATGALKEHVGHLVYSVIAKFRSKN
jgi:uncharacterized SAM-binding protein YcdF (DUF218 family)